MLFSIFNVVCIIAFNGLEKISIYNHYLLSKFPIWITNTSFTMTYKRGKKRKYAFDLPYLFDLPLWMDTFSVFI